MSLILANVWKFKVGYRQFAIQTKYTRFQAMSNDKKRTLPEKNLNEDEGNIICCVYTFIKCFIKTVFFNQIILILHCIIQMCNCYHKILFI